MLSTSDNNKCNNYTYTNNNLSDGATRPPTTQIHNEQFHFDNMSPPSSTNYPNCQNCKRQQIDDSRDDVHTQCYHRHIIPLHHPAHNTNTNSYHHPHRIDIEDDDHRYAWERTYHPSESTRQYYPQQHSYNHHPRRTQSDPPPPPPTPTHPLTHASDPHCRLVSSDSETIFQRNGHNHSSGCRNTSSCVGRLCCGGVNVGEDRHHKYHSRQISSPNHKCTDTACRYHHHHYHQSQEEYREYDPSMDRRHYDRADNYGRHELRDAPPPPPLSPLTIPTVVNCPAAVADNRRYHGCSQTCTEATICSDGGRYDDYNNGLDGRGYHSHPQDCCHHHDHRTDGYNHKKHPYNYDLTRNAPTRDVYPTTTEYTPSPRHHRHPPPPPPPPPPYASPHHVDYPSNQQPHSYPYETSNKLRLSVEIPNSPPPLPNQHTSSTIPSSSRRPPIHNNLNGNGGGGGSRSRTQTNPHRQYHSTTTPSSSAFAEYEKSQSESRQHLLREICAATTMRNSALDEDDRNFWERQIDTLNQSFRKL
jgi:hypothetical protein